MFTARSLSPPSKLFSPLINPKGKTKRLSRIVSSPQSIHPRPLRTLSHQLIFTEALLRFQTRVSALYAPLTPEGAYVRTRYIRRRKVRTSLEDGREGESRVINSLGSFKGASRQTASRAAATTGKNDSRSRAAPFQQLLVVATRSKQKSVFWSRDVTPPPLFQVNRHTKRCSRRCNSDWLFVALPPLHSFVGRRTR